MKSIEQLPKGRGY